MLSSPTSFCSPSPNINQIIILTINMQTHLSVLLINPHYLEKLLKTYHPLSLNASLAPPCKGIIFNSLINLFKPSSLFIISPTNLNY